MLGLPISTEIHKVITKKKVYEHFGAEMSAERRKSFDADIARIVLTNEVSPVSVNIAAGECVNSFFVVLIGLKRDDFDKQNIAFLAKMFGQKLLLVLEYEGKQALAVWRTRLILSPWAAPDTLRVELNGLNLDSVWENIVAELAGIQVQQGVPLEEQLAAQQKQEKLEKEIARLEKMAWAEKQPKRKFAIMKQIMDLKKEKK